ncbi:MAG: hypothetical protein ACQEVA_12595 [Myxococcota bacterium]
MNVPSSYIMTWLGSLALLAGCATGSDQTPVQAAFADSSSAVETSIAEAEEEAEDQDAYELRIRYNEPHCGAPGFEILVYGRWTRVFLDGRESLLNELEDSLVGEDASAGLRNALAYGTLVGERETQQGLEFPVLEVERFEPVDNAAEQP